MCFKWLRRDSTECDRSAFWPFCLWASTHGCSPAFFCRATLCSAGYHKSESLVTTEAGYLTHIHTHTRLTALCLGLPRWAGTRKVKPIWILLKQETVSGSGISWAICKSAHRSRQISMFFTGRMPFLPPNQQCQSTKGTNIQINAVKNMLAAGIICSVNIIMCGPTA